MVRVALAALLLVQASAGQPEDRLLKKLASWRSERRLSSESHEQRHASVHWRYNSPLGSQPIDAWYNEVTPTASSKTTYFSVLGHQFGYAGIQQIGNDPFTGMVIFSIWDPDSCSEDDMNACEESKRARITQCGPGVTCTRFGDEGSGAKTFFDFHDWKIGESYQFLLKAQLLPDGKAEYTCWFHAEGHGEAFKWRLMASIVIDIEGHSWWIKSMYSFVEQWTAKDVEDKRSAAFGPALVRGNGADAIAWNQITSAKWTTHNQREVTGEGSGHFEVSDKHINGEVTAAGDKWELTIGGNVTKESEVNQVFTVPASPTCPSALLEAVAKDVEGLLPTAPPPQPTVFCGGGNDGDGGRARYASTCAECYEGWVFSCQGECSYNYRDGTCGPAGRRLAMNGVMCIPDGFEATTCDQDPSCHAQCEDPPALFSRCFGASGAAFSDCKQTVQAECCKGLGYSTGFCCNDKSQRVKGKDVCQEDRNAQATTTEPEASSATTSAEPGMTAQATTTESEASSATTSAEPGTTAQATTTESEASSATTSAEPGTTAQATTTEPEASSATTSAEPGTTAQASAGEPDSSSSDSPSPATTSAEPGLTETPSASGDVQTTTEDAEGDPADLSEPNVPSPTGTEDVEIESTLSGSMRCFGSAAAGALAACILALDA